MAFGLYTRVPVLMRPLIPFTDLSRVLTEVRLESSEPS